MSSDVESRATPLAAVNIAAVTLAAIITALRCFVRIRLLKAFGIDDYLMVAAMACFAVYCSFSLAGVSAGTGQHIDNLTKEQDSLARKWWWFCYPTYAVTMTLTKMSIAFFFRRVIVERVHKIVLFVSVTLTIISCTVFFFACIFQCWPVSYFWDKHNQTGTCIPDQVVIALAFLFSAISIVTDFAFALMPAWILSHLNMQLKTKIALGLLMGLGCVASAAVVVRLPYMHLIASDNFLYDTVDVAIWSTIEQALAIIAGGLATLQPLVKLIAFKLGLRPYPGSSPNHLSSYANNLRGGASGRNGATISVKRSFAHRTEAFTPAHNKQFGDDMGLQLQPGVAAYSAACYNTSQELLREPTSGSGDGKTTLVKERDLETGSEDSTERIVPASPPYRRS